MANLLLLESRATSSGGPPAVPTVNTTHTQLRNWRAGMTVFLLMLWRFIGN